MRCVDFQNQAWRNGNFIMLKARSLQLLNNVFKHLASNSSLGRGSLPRLMRFIKLCGFSESSYKDPCGECQRARALATFSLTWSMVCVEAHKWGRSKYCQNQPASDGRYCHKCPALGGSDQSSLSKRLSKVWTPNEDPGRNPSRPPILSRIQITRISLDGQLFHLRQIKRLGQLLEQIG